MKFEVYDDKYIVFLNKEEIKNINFKIKDQVEECFKKVFSKLKRRLTNDLSGFFYITAYLDHTFGVVLVITKEDLEYYDYFSNQIDMQIEIEQDSKILLEFEDLFYINSNNIVSYNGKFYTRYNDGLNYLEFSNIIYGDKVEEILRKGKPICDM